MTKIYLEYIFGHTMLLKALPISTNMCITNLWTLNATSLEVRGYKSSKCEEEGAILRTFILQFCSLYKFYYYSTHCLKNKVRNMPHFKRHIVSQSKNDWSERMIAVSVIFPWKFIFWYQAAAPWWMSNVKPQFCTRMFAGFFYAQCFSYCKFLNFCQNCEDPDSN